jgi:hypothetical protein
MAIELFTPLRRLQRSEYRGAQGNLRDAVVRG